MRSLWWKILCCALLLYVAVFSFKIPLGAGLIGVENGQLQVGSNEVIVYGYNTHFNDDGLANYAYLEQDSIFSCLEITKVVSNDELVLKVDIPQELQKNYFNLYIKNSKEIIFLANAIYANGTEKKEGARLAACDPSQSGKTFNLNLTVPFQPLVFETIRNLVFHVPLWFCMFVLMGISFYNSISYLRKGKIINDIRSNCAVGVGLVFCTTGLLTGSVWARFTWGAWWVSDPQLNGALVTFLAYLGFAVLRMSIEDHQKRAKISAIFNIFAFVLLFVLLLILPRFTPGLHPGKDGNPGFNTYDLNNVLRMVFYPAVVGWIILGVWIYKIRLRIARIEQKLYYDESV